MRKQFISTANDVDSGYSQVPGLYIDSDGDEFDMLPGLVAHDAEWASVAVEVEGGYMVFESVEDYKTWKNQK